ncbi:MAG: tryptophan 7-halogenase [Woeseiaceae bacterium]|nr:tryptophan 7-halogenase [Woeseiaceae bacterium]
MKNIRQVTIVGGGMAGWMTAAALARFLDGTGTEIQLFEPGASDAVGVGEGTIPAIHDFNAKLDIDEQELMRATDATFKLGVEFVDWMQKGHAYMHPFGRYGLDMNGIAFHHYWRRLREAGDTSDISAYSLATAAAKQGRFSHPTSDANSIYASYSYAYHLDAGLYARFLRRYCERRGVTRTLGRIVDVTLDPESGNIGGLQLADGRTIGGDLFVDCSDFRGLLIGETLGTDYEDWSRWFPCDRAVIVPSEKTDDPDPYTRVTARDAGWQWRIPLQRLTGNGHVYSSQYVSDEEAVATLLANAEGEPGGDPNFLRFTTGKRVQTWKRNCVAIGSSGGFLEPLESTSTWLIQAAIIELTKWFPTRDFHEADIDAFNRAVDKRFEEVRDFLIAHYCCAGRDDTDFWRARQSMPIPDSLQHRIDVFRASGHVVLDPSNLFDEDNWLSVLIGQGVLPSSWHPRTDSFDDGAVDQRLGYMRSMVEEAAAAMPSHGETLNRYREAEDA